MSTIIHDSDLTNKQKDMAVHHIPIHEIYQETPIEELKTPTVRDKQRHRIPFRYG